MSTKAAARRLRIADIGKACGARIALGLDRSFGTRAHGRFGILLYHRIAERPTGLPGPTLSVTPTRFRSQIEGLLDRGFRFATVGSVLARAEAGGRIPLRTAVLTFDDGFAGLYEHAWPILRKLDVPATLFVATAFLDRGNPFPFDSWGVEHAGVAPRDTWVPLTWTQCREMTDAGILEIGTHTHTHADFRRRPEAFHRDLEASLSAIRDGLELSTSLLSFPFGNVHKGFAGDELVAVARNLGIRCGLTTGMDLVAPSTAPFRWGRFEAVGTDTAATLEAKLEGWYSWMETGRRLFRAMTR